MFAECRHLLTLDVEGRELRAKITRATLADDVHHVVASMFLAVQRRPAALHIEIRLHRARLMRATLPEDVHHAVMSVAFAEGRCPAALYVERRVLCA